MSTEFSVHKIWVSTTPSERGKGGLEDFSTIFPQLPNLLPAPVFGHKSCGHLDISGKSKENSKGKKQGKKKTKSKKQRRVTEGFLEGSRDSLCRDSSKQRVLTTLFVNGF